MAFVFLAHAPEDREFAERLSRDLNAANIPTWSPSESATDELVEEHLKETTHLVSVLSPAATQNEKFLHILEVAKKNHVEHVALRLAVIDAVPTQLTGIIPLDFSQPDNYADGVTTLIEDLRIEPAEPPLQLPEDILMLLKSEDVTERKAGVEALAQFRLVEGPLRQMALDKLETVAFHERDSALKILVRATIQTFLIQEEDTLPPEIALPTREALVKQAEASGLPVFVGNEGVQPHAPRAAPTRRQVYLWQQNTQRWYMVLLMVGLVIGGVAFLLTSELIAIIPMLVTGSVLAYFNIWIRHNGAFEWTMPKPLIGNGVVGSATAGISAIILMLSSEANSNFFIISLLLGLFFGLFTGWLSAVKLETV